MLSEEDIRRLETGVRNLLADRGIKDEVQATRNAISIGSIHAELPPDADAAFVDGFIAAFRNKLATPLKVKARRVVRLSETARRTLNNFIGGEGLNLTNCGGIESGLIAMKVARAVHRGDVVLEREVSPEFVGS